MTVHTGLLGSHLRVQGTRALDEAPTTGARAAPSPEALKTPWGPSKKVDPNQLPLVLGQGTSPVRRATPANQIRVDVPAVSRRLSGAIKIPTISKRGEATHAEAFQKLHGYLEESYPAAHAAMKRETVADHSLMYTWEGSDPSLPPIVLMGHMDVVDVEPGTEGEWTHPPFDGVVTDGHIHGRGSLDDKLNVLAALEAVEHYAQKGQRPKRTVILSFGHDEETEGTGAQAVAQTLQDRGIRPAMILDEGLMVGDGLVPGVERPVAMISVAEKGYLTVELTTEEAGGHSSTPPKSTAVGRLAKAVSALEENQMPADLREPASSFLRAIREELPWLERQAIGLGTSDLLGWATSGIVTSNFEDTAGGNALVRTTTAPTVFEAGSQENVLATRARAVVNFRILPGDSVQDVLDHIRETVDDDSISIRTVGEAHEPSAVSSTESPTYRAMSQITKELYPDALVAPSLMLAATDSRHFGNLAENTYRFLPVKLTEDDVATIHASNERISQENYANLIRFNIALMGRLAHPS